MAVKSIFWPNITAQDIHLIPGYVGPQLDHLLWIEDTTGNVPAKTPPVGVTVSFAANFVVGPATAGVAVSASGEVTVTGPLPAPPRLLDFIVTATVTEGTNTFKAYKRFYIHEAITRIWLTPPLLTVRQNAKNVRFSVMAEFTDGTQGDLTTWCPWNLPGATDRTFVRENGGVDPAIFWGVGPGGTAGLSVVSATGRLTSTVVAGNAPITASIRPLPSPPNRMAGGTSQASQPWSTTVTLERVDGPGFDAMARVRNILILPDGFEAGEKPAFRRLAVTLVHALRTRQKTTPFDLLKDQFNYFLAWVPSPEPGISALERVERFNVSGVNADAEEVDTSVSETNVVVAGIGWHVGTPPTPVLDMRFLLNERNSAFHVVLGYRPKALRRGNIRDAYFNALRFDEDDFDEFLKALRRPSGVSVGGVWARGGKDDTLIVVLSRSLRLGGSNSYRQPRPLQALPDGRYIGATLSRRPRHRIENNAAGLGKDLRTDAIPNRLDVELWTTVAHEMAHSFKLKDEYGGLENYPDSRVAELAKIANVQARVDLLTGGSLDGDKIKWRWPRLTKAGVLDVVPLLIDPTTRRYRILLRPGHGVPLDWTDHGFDVGNVVRLRAESLLESPSPSARFIVIAAAISTPAGDQVDIEALTASPFDPTDYPPGSLLIAPKRAPDPDPANRVFGDDLELVHADIRARINSTHNPLNASFTDPPNRLCPPPGANPFPNPTPATNFPLGVAPQPPIFPSWIVGLYENADEFNCGVYRPTGACIMRTLHYVEAPSNKERAYQFCPVCRYAMVDLIDPTKHRDIDNDYDSRYPT